MPEAKPHVEPDATDAEPDARVLARLGSRPQVSPNKHNLTSYHATWYMVHGILILILRDQSFGFGFGDI